MTATVPEFRARFRREVDAARKVSGLYTALLVDADPDGRMPWLATVYVPGPSLADAVADHGPLPPASVLMLAAGLAESLAAIHAADLVHRDLKPSNVLLADDGPRVIDFGISRATEASALTHTGLVVGSPGFMSPEQAEGGEVGGRRAMSSASARCSPTPPPGTARSAPDPRPRWSTVCVHGTPALDGISADLRALIERCLTKDPGMRPTAPDLLAELGDVGVTAGWLPAPLTKEVSAHADRAPQLTATEAGKVQAITPSQEPAFSPTVTRPSVNQGGKNTPPRPAALVATLAAPAGKAAYAVRFGRNGDVLAAANANGRVYLWDVASSQLSRTFADPGSNGVIGVDFCPDGELLAAADDNGRLYLWDLVDGHLTRTFVRRRSKSMNGVAFGLGGDVLAGANDDGRIYLWDVVSGRLAGTFPNPDSQGVIGVAFDRDTELLAAADDNGRVYLWDVVSGDLAATLEHPDSQGLNDVAFSPEGELLAAAAGSGKASVWDVASGQLAQAFTASGDSAVYTVSFAPDGRVLAAGDADGHVYLWDRRRRRPGRDVRKSRQPGREWHRVQSAR